MNIQSEKGSGEAISGSLFGTSCCLVVLRMEGGGGLTLGRLLWALGYRYWRDMFLGRESLWV